MINEKELFIYKDVYFAPQQGNSNLLFSPWGIGYEEDKYILVIPIQDKKLLVPLIKEIQDLRSFYMVRGIKCRKISN